MRIIFSLFFASIFLDDSIESFKFFQVINFDLSRLKSSLIFFLFEKSFFLKIKKIKKFFLIDFKGFQGNLISAFVFLVQYILNQRFFNLFQKIWFLGIWRRVA